MPNSSPPAFSMSDFRGLAAALDREDTALVCAGFGRADGGLGVLTATSEEIGCEVIDRISTTGLATNGELVARVVQSVEYDGAGYGELALYDVTGLVRLERLDGVGALHDVAFDSAGPAAARDTLLVVSTGTNQVLRYVPDSLTARLVPVWAPGPRSDAWHLNCLATHEGHWLVSAFGRHDHHRGWNDQGVDTSGELIDLATGTTVIDGLSRPHSPRRWRDHWVVCDAGAHGLTIVADDPTQPRRFVDCGGWVRGLAVVGDTAVAARSGRRHGDEDTEPGARHCRLLLVSLVTGAITDTLEIPFQEIYDLTLVPRALVDGLTRGGATNALRLLERAAVERYWPGPYTPLGNPPLAPADQVASLDVQVPDLMESESTALLDVTVHYHGRVAVVSAGHHAVRLGWYWDDWNGPHQGRVGFTAPLRAGEPATLRCPVTAPPSPGRHTLHLGVVQEHVAWFAPTVTVDVDITAAPVRLRAPAATD